MIHITSYGIWGFSKGLGEGEGLEKGGVWGWMAWNVLPHLHFKDFL